ncbi:MAG: NUDIX hydrolase [Anaerolineae bacterium]
MLPLATAQNGDQLVLFQHGDAPHLLDSHPSLPISFACVVAKHAGQTLFVFNAWRREWELPAGVIEPNESPDAAAARELLEETSQSCMELRCVAMALLYLANSQVFELGAIFTGDITTLRAFEANEEASQIMFWQAGMAVDGSINALGLKLVELVGALGL